MAHLAHCTYIQLQTTLIEPTSGNTGIGLAFIAAAKVRVDVVSTTSDLYVLSMLSMKSVPSIYRQELIRAFADHAGTWWGHEAARNRENAAPFGTRSQFLGSCRHAAAL